MFKRAFPYALAAALFFSLKILLVGSAEAYWMGLDALLACSAFAFCYLAIRRELPTWMAGLLFLLLTFNPYTFRFEPFLLNEKFAASLVLLLLTLFLTFTAKKSPIGLMLFSILTGLGTAILFFCSRYPFFAISLLGYGVWLAYHSAERRFSLGAFLPLLSALFIAALLWLGCGTWPYSGKFFPNELANETLSPSALARWKTINLPLLKNAVAEAAERTVNPQPPGDFNKKTFEIIGWVFGVQAPIVEVSLQNHDGKKIAGTRRFSPRPDVQAAFQGDTYPLVPLATAFLIRPTIPYYYNRGIMIVLTDATGKKYVLPTEEQLTRNESFIINIEKSKQNTAPLAKLFPTSKYEAYLWKANEWISRRLFFFFLAAFACLLFPRRYPEAVLAFIPTVTLLAVGVLSACLQIPFSFLPGDILIRPQEVFLISMFYPVLAVLAIYLAFRKIRATLPASTPELRSPVKFFAISAAIFGVLLIFAMPPFQAADEGAHFFKAYQISEWNLSSKQVPPSLYRIRDLFDYLPFHPERKTSVKQILSARDIPLNAEEKGAAPILNYSPIPYFPAAAGIFAGRHLLMPPLDLLYLGRIGSLLAYIFLVSLAIRLMPIQKWALALFALTPMCMAQASAVTVDTLTLALSYLTFAYILNLSLGETSLRLSHWARLVLLLVLVTLTKPVYFVLSFLFLLIPRQKVGPLAKYWLGFIGLICLSAATAKGWISINEKLQTYEAMGPSKNQQLSTLLHHPIDFFHIYVATFRLYGAGYLEHLIGRLGWLDTGLPNSFRLFYLWLLTLFAVFGWSRNAALSWLKRLLILSTITTGVSLVAFFLFLTWTPRGSPTIEGIQGRYFLPFVPLFMLMIYPHRKFWVTPKEFPPFALAWSASALAIATTVGSVILRYYLAI